MASKKLRRFSLILGIVLLLSGIALAAYFFVLPPSREGQFVRAVSNINEAFIEGLIAKSTGDDIMSGRKKVSMRNDVVLAAESKEASYTFSMKVVAERARNEWSRLRKADTPQSLMNYSVSVENWLLSVATNAEEVAGGGAPLKKAQQNWKKVPAEPAPVQIQGVSESALNAAFQKSLSEIRVAREVGSEAVSLGDRDMMRIAAASLQVQNHWLKNSQPKPKPCPPRHVCGSNVQKILPGIYRSAWGYVAGEPKAGTQWNQEWKAADLAIEGGGQAIGGTGITEGEKPKGEPFWFQLAARNCKNIGGTVQRSEGSYSFTCYYSTKRVTQCTYLVDGNGNVTPNRDPRCQPGVQSPPQKPVQPPVKPPEPKQRLEDFDGYYEGQVSMSIVSAYYSFGPITQPTSFRVSNGKIVGDMSGLIVDSTGRAKATITVPGGYGVSGGITQVIQFSRSGGGVVVKGNVSGSVSSEGVNVTIKGTISARRVSR